MSKRTGILKIILKKQKARELTLPDFNTYYKTTVQCGTGKTTDIQNNGREYAIQK